MKENKLWGEYVVYAYTSAGQSKTFGRTSMIAVGSPYSLPFHESFTNGLVNKIWGKGTLDNGGIWQFLTDCDISSF